MSEPSPPGKELAVPQPAAHAGPAAPRDLSWMRDRLRSITWTPRLAAGAGLFVTALFLLPFAGWPWLPVVIGLGVLVLLRLLRLDGLMRGWAPHVAGAVIVALLLARTSPWVWALGLSLGIVVAGLLRLPRWHVVAVGAALMLASGIGYGFTLKQANADQLQQQIQRGNENREQLGERTVANILPAMAYYTARNDSATVCALLTDAAEKQFADAVAAQDCRDAVDQMSRQVTDVRRFSEPVRVQISELPGRSTIDGCSASWDPPTPAAGPHFGKLVVEKNSSGKFFVSGYAPCP